MLLWESELSKLLNDNSFGAVYLTRSFCAAPPQSDKSVPYEFLLLPNIQELWDLFSKTLTSGVDVLSFSEGYG